MIAWEQEKAERSRSGGIIKRHEETLGMIYMFINLIVFWFYGYVHMSKLSKL